MRSSLSHSHHRVSGLESSDSPPAPPNPLTSPHLKPVEDMCSNRMDSGFLIRLISSNSCSADHDPLLFVCRSRWHLVVLRKAIWHVDDRLTSDQNSSPVNYFGVVSGPMRTRFDPTRSRSNVTRVLMDYHTTARITTPTPVNHVTNSKGAQSSSPFSCSESTPSHTIFR